MDRGELVPDDVTIGMLAERISQPDAAGGFVLDGFPRTLDQAAALDRLLAERGARVSGVLDIEVPGRRARAAPGRAPRLPRSRAIPTT